MLPKDKPRYLMGVGYPIDLVVCVSLGVDMFDCVYPTRTARFGDALVDIGKLRLKAKEYAMQKEPIESHCLCSTCQTYSRAALHIMLKDKNALASQLLTIHNITYMMRLMRSMRDAILQGPKAYEKYIQLFFQKQFPKNDYPLWCIEALVTVGISLI